MKEFKQLIKIKVLRTVALLLAGTAAGFVALILAHCLPTEPMRLHVWQSYPMIEKEFHGYVLLYNYPATLPGNFTDCLMLENAIYQNKEHSLLEQVLYMYRGESGEGEGWAPGYSLGDYLSGIEQGREVSYARYWHGYLVFLKPLLLIANFQTVRIAAAAIQLVLVGLLALICGKKQESFLGAAFLVSVPFLYFFSLYASLSLSICFYIMAAALALQLLFHDRLEKGWYGEFFLVVGCATAYFDFLTYPLVTLGFPLCVYLYLHKGTFGEQCRRLVGYTLEWIVGYLGLWAMKWVLADVLTGGGIIRDGIMTLRERTGGVEGLSLIGSYLTALKLNLGEYANMGFGLFFLGILVWLFAALWRKRGCLLNRKAFLEACPVWLLMLYPFGWFLLSQNHSEQHYVFTCKILALSVFAFVCGVGKWIRQGSRKDG